MRVLNCLNIIKMMSFIFVSTSFTVCAYELPNGVPNPIDNWGTSDTGEIVNPISGEAPESWEVASESGLPAYYIDSSSSNATNSNNTYGSPDKPRSTIPEITYEAGSYIEIHGGPYNGGGQIIFNANGAPEKPIWIRGLSSSELGNISGEMIVKGQYVILENLNFIKQKLGFRSNNSSYVHHATIRNSFFEGTGEVANSSSAVIAVEGRKDKRFHDIIIYNNTIHSYGKSFIDSDPSLGESIENDYHGVKVTKNSDRIWVVKNEIYNLGGDSVQIGNATVNDGERSKGVYITDNDFYENLENGVDIKAADDTLIINNRIWGFVRHKNNSSSGGGIIIHSKASNTWVVNNEIFNSAGGIAATDSSLNTWVIGNVIKNIQHPEWDTDWAGGLYDSGSAIHFRGGSSGGAINNTIINYDKGIEAASGEYVFLNNILFNRNNEAGNDLFVESTDNDVLVKSNLVFSESSSLKENNVNCLLCLYQNPDFSDLLVDEALSSDSAALASGYDMQSYLDQYQDVFETVLNKDIYNNNRFVGSIDVGAVENQFSSEIKDAGVGLPNAAEILDIKVINTNNE
ncbi:right-handed parallel beta-helix repeat-containing protein [Psychromonas arctica]|uniref:Right-handed parallel beta-helix repeat-containing protein n=1 Tax=Psychromonas arctica TaxID=168275 RepID=A0ABU9H7P6_9GAMM